MTDPLDADARDQGARRQRRERRSHRKDRLVQARVPESLEATLKEEARRRRTSVSQMIRDVLEDAFDLVDGVVANVDQIVGDSARLAERVGRDARRLGRSLRGQAPACDEPLPEAEARLAAVQAWNPVVLNRPAPCSRCGAELARGERVYVGLADDPAAPRAWLCSAAVEGLQEEDA